MIEIQTFKGNPTLFVVLLVLLVLSGCGGDKQEEAKILEQQAAVYERNLVPEHLVGGTEADSLLSAEVTPVSKPAASSEQVASSLAEVTSHFKEKGTPKASVVNNTMQGAKVKQNGGDYAVMMGSFVRQDNASGRADEIKQLGFKTDLETATVDGKTYYRVQLREIESFAEAKNLGLFLKGKLGSDYLVLKR